MKKYIYLIILFLYSCISVPKQYKILAPGIWRASLILNDSRQVFITRGIDKVVTRDTKPESTQLVIPFNFNVIYNSDSSFYIEVLNAEEKIIFDSIQIGRDIKTGNDTMVIHLRPYAAILKCIYENNKISGEFIVQDKVNYSIPFIASYGQSYRFDKIPEKTNYNISGEWDAQFAYDSTDRFNAIGEFKQMGNHLTGTFRTESGDFRFLQGEISNDHFNLSAFDGAHAYLFTGQIIDSTIQGKYYSGKHYTCDWKAQRLKKNNLVPADSMSKIIHNNELIIKLLNSENKWISNVDPEYQGKAKVIQITGTWCPNCREETDFLIDYLKNNPNPNLSVFAIAFERYHEPSKSLERIKQYKKAMKIPYDILLGGNSNKDSSSLIFPQIDGIKAYPTLIFLDKNNHIMKVHTGFDGPATSKFNEFKEYFSKTIKEISN